MSECAISVNGLGKHYALGETLSNDLLSARLSQTIKGLFRRSPPNPQAPRESGFWALRDINFDLRKGEVLGVIGRNGAGKSTLLKILSRITEPTEGEARLRGKVASLLEVGTGFHKELTGRENVFLNGAILGMGRTELRRKFDEIVAFSGVERFIDTPIKRYSSGMTVRLAFAVAAYLDPEILLIDEVLAVGDADFQKRCINKMKDISGEGRTIVFVSHNLNAVQSLCTRCLWLDRGKYKLDGLTRDVLHSYRSDGQLELGRREWTDPISAPGNDQFRLSMIEAASSGLDGSEMITITSGIDLTIEFWNLEPGAKLNLSIHVTNEDEAMVFNALPLEDTNWFGKDFPTGRYRAKIQIPPRLINSGTHKVEVLAVHDQSRVVFKLEEALSFEVSDVPEPEISWHGRIPGAIRPRLAWRTEFLGEA